MNPHTKRTHSFDFGTKGASVHYGVGVKYPDLREEKKLWKKGFKRVACVDEAGRGPLAGPVVAAAVVIQNTKYPKGNPSVSYGAGKIQNAKIRDSKKLSPKKREEFFKILTNPSAGGPHIKWGIGRVSEKTIDRINIKNAAELAMEKALRKLKVDFLIIDGNNIKNLKLKSYNFKLMVRADEKVFSCAMASIIAKVTRDRIMMGYHKKYPRYGFDKHKGYPTKYHLARLKKYGPCKIHRRSFRPVAEIKKSKC